MVKSNIIVKFLCSLSLPSTQVLKRPSQSPFFFKDWEVYNGVIEVGRNLSRSSSLTPLLKTGWARCPGQFVVTFVTKRVNQNVVQVSDQGHILLISAKCTSWEQGGFVIGCFLSKAEYHSRWVTCCWEEFFLWNGRWCIHYLQPNANLGLPALHTKG